MHLKEFCKFASNHKVRSELEKLLALSTPLPEVSSASTVLIPTHTRHSLLQLLAQALGCLTRATKPRGFCCREPWVRLLSWPVSYGEPAGTCSVLRLQLIVSHAITEHLSGLHCSGLIYALCNEAMLRVLQFGKRCVRRDTAR